MLSKKSSKNPKNPLFLFSFSWDEWDAGGETATVYEMFVKTPDLLRYICKSHKYDMYYDMPY